MYIFLVHFHVHFLRIKEDPTLIHSHPLQAANRRITERRDPHPSTHSRKQPYARAEYHFLISKAPILPPLLSISRRQRRVTSPLARRLRLKSRHSATPGQLIISGGIQRKAGLFRAPMINSSGGGRRAPDKNKRGTIAASPLDLHKTLSLSGLPSRTRPDE